MVKTSWWDPHYLREGRKAPEFHLSWPMRAKGLPQQNAHPWPSVDRGHGVPLAYREDNNFPVVAVLTTSLGSSCPLLERMLTCSDLCGAQQTSN